MFCVFGFISQLNYKSFHCDSVLERSDGDWIRNKILSFITQVWPGLTAYPDFSDNVTHEWWYDNLLRFHKKVPFDGLWIVSMEMWDIIE